MADPLRDRENDLQPDPMLREGRSSGAWMWVIGVAIVAVLVVFFVATTGDRQTAQGPGADRAPPVTTGSGAERQQPPDLPGGRGTSSAPPAGQNTETVR